MALRSAQKQPRDSGTPYDNLRMVSPNPEGHHRDGGGGEEAVAEQTPAAEAARGEAGFAGFGASLADGHLQRLRPGHGLAALCFGLAAAAETGRAHQRAPGCGPGFLQPT